MDFDLSDEQYALQDGLRRFLSDKFPLERLRKVIDDSEHLDKNIWREMAGLGYAGICVPEDHAGLGLGILDAAIVSEIIGYSAAPGHYLAHTMAVIALSKAGSAEQKSSFLPGLAGGEYIATMALGEESERWFPEQWTLQFIDGRLNGSKRNVLFADDADFAIVGLAGGGLVLVRMDAPGVSVERVDGIDRTRSISWLHFDGVPCELLPQGEQVSTRVIDAGLVLLAADAFGGATRALELSAEYLGDRSQFGKTLNRFQAIKHQFADAATLVESARGLYWYAAYAYDREPHQSARIAALAKALLADRYEMTARRMIEFHGGIGFTWEHHAQVWYKRAMFNRYYLGQPAVHRERAVQLADW